MGETGSSRNAAQAAGPGKGSGLWKEAGSQLEMTSLKRQGESVHAERAGLIMRFPARRPGPAQPCSPLLWSIPTGKGENSDFYYEKEIRKTKVEMDAEQALQGSGREGQGGAEPATGELAVKGAGGQRPGIKASRRWVAGRTKAKPA